MSQHTASHGRYSSASHVHALLHLTSIGKTGMLKHHPCVKQPAKVLFAHAAQTLCQKSPASHAKADLLRHTAAATQSSRSCVCITLGVQACGAGSASVRAPHTCSPPSLVEGLSAEEEHRRLVHRPRQTLSADLSTSLCSPPRATYAMHLMVKMVEGCCGLHGHQHL